MFEHVAKNTESYCERFFKPFWPNRLPLFAAFNCTIWVQYATERQTGRPFFYRIIAAEPHYKQPPHPSSRGIAHSGLRHQRGFGFSSSVLALFLYARICIQFSLFIGEALKARFIPAQGVALGWNSAAPSGQNSPNPQILRRPADAN